jgi:hypothetical protein
MTTPECDRNSAFILPYSIEASINFITVNRSNGVENRLDKRLVFGKPRPTSAVLPAMRSQNKIAQ